MVDEASDTYDTIDWLLKNVPGNNGKVGQWGISYPGFYASMGALSRHPALVASSPQAPVTDFFFEDFHHNGALTQAYFYTYPIFDVRRPGLTTDNWWGPALERIAAHGTPDDYFYQLALGRSRTRPSASMRTTRSGRTSSTIPTTMPSGGRARSRPTSAE